VDTRAWDGLEVQHGYSEATGRLGLSRVGIGSSGQQIQYLHYGYDQIGNVLTRTDGPTNRTESFTYDGLDRLRTHTLSGAVAASSTVAYAANGNIETKSGVGTYAYGTGAGPHAVTEITGTDALAGRSFLYDAVGNQTHRKFGTTLERAQSWTSFNQARRLEAYNELGAVTQFSEFAFGAGHERVRQVSHLGTTTYVGALFERFRPTGPGAVAEDKHCIYAPTGRVAVYIQRSTQKHETNWFHTDGLGSITGVTNAAGVLVQRFAFDAWGKRLNPSTNGVITGATSGGITRGYTDHEQLDDLGLIHMNGRVYDQALGRFLSADPFVGDTYDAQDYNRYSYVGNNPMNATDPSGYFSLKDVAKIVAVVVVAWVTAGAALYAYAAMTGGAFVGGFAGALSSVGLAAGWSGGWAVAAGVGAGFGSGFAMSLLNGGSIGDAFKAGVIGGIVGGISAGIAGKIGDLAGQYGFEGTAVQHAAHGIAQGGLTEAQGGEFRHGFYAGFASSAVGGPLQEAMPDTVFGRTAAAAVVGGTASALGGGKFANGAVSGAFTHLFNNEAHLERRLDRRIEAYQRGDITQEQLLALHAQDANAALTAASFWVPVERVFAFAPRVFNWARGLRVFSKAFGSEAKLAAHFEKHGAAIGKALGKESYSAAEYAADANYVIRNGQYVQELNGYVRFLGAEGRGNYAFVGVDRARQTITTFHVKSVSELAREAPSLGIIR
jgi:RHS repeat-associated protein